MLKLATNCEIKERLFKKKKRIMHVLSPWPGESKLILNSDMDNEKKDFQGGCEERIRAKWNHAFGPPQRYQITADTSPTTPRALAPITSREGKAGRCSWGCADVCVSIRTLSVAVLWGRKCVQLSGFRDKISPSQGCCNCVCNIQRTNVCQVVSSMSVSCVQSARDKVMDENEMSPNKDSIIRNEDLTVVTHVY